MTLQQKYLYHGSKKLIKNTLLPFPSKVVNGDMKVFATPSKGFALMFMGKKWHDDDIELGYNNEKNILYAIEKKKNIFKKVFVNRTGYLYKVSAKQFHTDDRLGMKHHEFIADEPVKIISTIVINDVYKELLKSNIILYTFDKIKFIYFNQKKNNSDIITLNNFNGISMDNIILNIKSYTKKNIVVNCNVDYESIWKYVYNINKNDIITKLGLVEIKKNDYSFIIYT